MYLQAPSVYDWQVEAISYSEGPTHSDLILDFYILSKALNHPELWVKFLSKTEEHNTGLSCRLPEEMRHDI